MAKTIILPDGTERPCFDLIMRKENAWDILDGKKGLEFRAMSDFYIKKFLVPKTSLQETLDAFEVKDVNFVHFHDYNNSWFLDVYVEYVGPICIHYETRKILHMARCHEFDEEIERTKRENVKPEDALQCFMMPITGIFGTNLTTPDKIKATGGGFGDTWLAKYYQDGDERKEWLAAFEALENAFSR